MTGPVVSDELKEEASQQATKIWDTLCADSKTRELASLIANNVRLTSDSERLQVLKETGATTEAHSGTQSPSTTCSTSCTCTSIVVTVMPG